MDEGRSGEGNGEEKEVGEADLHGVDSLIEALREVRTFPRTFSVKSVVSDSEVKGFQQKVYFEIGFTAVVRFAS